MMTHTLDQNRLASYYTLASGDTIDLAGHDLTWDIDGATTPVTIKNTAGHCNFICAQGGRVLLNKGGGSGVTAWALPSNVHPRTVAPLAEPSAFPTGLTANALFEFRLLGAFGLGGGDADLQCEKRAGAFWAKVLESGSGKTIAFDRPLPLHPGDQLACLYDKNDLIRYEVEDYDPSSNAVTLTTTPSRNVAGDAWALIAGGIVVRLMDTPTNGLLCLTSPMSAGSLSILSDYGGSNTFYATSSTLLANRFAFLPSSIAGSSPCKSYGRLFAKEAVLSYLKHHQQDYSIVAVDQVAACSFYSNNSVIGSQQVFVRSGVFGGSNASVAIPALPCVTTKIGGDFQNLSLPSPSKHMALLLENHSLLGIPQPDVWVEHGGTVTKIHRTDYPPELDCALPFVWLHQLASASDVTWRYHYHTVRAGATLRLRAQFWPLAPSSVASAAITDTKIWYPATNFDAFLEVLLDSTRQHGLLTWRNDSGSDTTVRVWECVTGDPDGGYLKVEEVKGGPM